MTRFCLILSVGCLVGFGSASVAEAQADLAKKTHAILKERCYSCHGEGGSNEGGFNYVLNRKRLVRELVVPGSPEESRLLERVSKGEMPPDGDRVSKEEIETLKEWIEGGATSFAADIKREFITPIDMLTFMLKDIERANDRDRPFMRYFTLTHLYNAGFEDNELESYRQGLSKLVNSLSWGREVRVPQPIDPAKTILRIDLRHYKWNENNAWQHIISADPYRVTFSNFAASACYSLTKCELPYVRADWFVVAASRPPLYHIILDVPRNVSSLEKRVGVDVIKNLQDYSDVVRAGFFPSGVSKSNRLIERHVSSYGAYWKSYDFKPADPKQPQRRQNLKANPTGPGGQHGFEHDGGEMIFSLPNGLQGYMLTDATGKRINKGPTDVVVDKEAVKRGRDPEVVNGLSCMNCHWSGMLNKTDQIRDHVLSQPMAYSPEAIEFVTAIYVPKNEFAAKLKEDRERFEAAIRKCGTHLTKSEPVATLAFQFDEPLDLDLAAAEAGVTPERLVAVLRANGELARQLGSLVQGQPIPRDTFVQQFAQLVSELKIGTFLKELVNPPFKNEEHSSIDNEPQRLIVPFDKRAAQASQQEWAHLLGKNTIFETNTIGMQLVLIPPGEFGMGASDDEPKLSDDDRRPQHQVRLTRPFYIGKYEVTVSEFEKVLSRNASIFTGRWLDDLPEPKSLDGSNRNNAKAKEKSSPNRDRSKYDRYPIESVTWFDAVEFCNALSAGEKLSPCYKLSGYSLNDRPRQITDAKVELLSGTGYRLPTEAEWEYCCRSGTATAYYFGVKVTQHQASINWRGANIFEPSGEVGSYQPNAFGLSDMHGHMSEWCQDWYDEFYYSRFKDVAENPEGPLLSNEGTRVVRGGSFDEPPYASSSSFRDHHKPGSANTNLGFRVVRSVSR